MYSGTTSEAAAVSKVGKQIASLICPRASLDIANSQLGKLVLHQKLTNHNCEVGQQVDRTKN